MRALERASRARGNDHEKANAGRCWPAAQISVNPSLTMIIAAWRKNSNVRGVVRLSLAHKHIWRTVSTDDKNLEISSAG